MDAIGLKGSKKKLFMWYKIRELKAKGLTNKQTAKELGLHRDTVAKYLKMTLGEFEASGSYQRMFVHKLDAYEDFVHDSLERHPYLSASQINDWLREQYPDLPQVNAKTVFNFVKYVRAKYGIDKSEEEPRQYEKVAETPYGEYAQVDFGESWMLRDEERHVKVYFFAMVMCRSRKKFVYFSRSPFTSALAVYAHELAFAYYGGKPKKIIYDQDRVFIKDENLGDALLTEAFRSFVSSEHFECVFCRKSDPESKGKVENAVQYVKKNFLRGRTFTDIEDLNAKALAWLSRTANGLPHAGTRTVPDKTFVLEKRHLLPYYGTPMRPADTVKEYVVRKDNTVCYRGNFYTVPTGTYQKGGTVVWADADGGRLQIYDRETGKQVADHPLCNGKGKLIQDGAHLRVRTPDRETLEAKIMECMNYDRLAALWLESLYREKPRYYRLNLKTLEREIASYPMDAMRKAFGICLDRGLYNAKELLAVCGRYARRVEAPVERLHDGDLSDLPDCAREMPEKTDINTYNTLFQ